MEMLIDTHAHIDGEEFKDDLPEVIERAKAAGIGKIFVPSTFRAWTTSWLFAINILAMLIR